MSDLKEDIGKAVRSVGKDWKKAKRRADREDRVLERDLRRMSWKPPKTSIKEAAFEVMEEAYLKASGGGRYYANARQIMYAARPRILELADVPWGKSTDRYFTQTLLKDYLEQYSPDWKVVWDARGHLTEPHTGEVIGLGGQEVKRYISDWTDGEIVVDKRQVSRISLKTSGPKLRFSAALFIEKEGFDPILKAAGLAERYDMAIMSSKGIPVGASCKLANRLHNAGVKVLVLRDFDKDGFKIVKTLRSGARLSPGTPVIDLGLRLEDVEGLPDEEVYYRQKKDPRQYLRRCGATAEECDFLVQGSPWRGWSGRRVELNAMTSDQLIEWLERKLEEVGVKKIIPGGDVLASAYRRAALLQEIDKETEKVRERFDKGAVDVPDDLGERIADRLKEKQELSWDDAVWEIAKRQN